jgi:hypothetical protein
MWFLNLVLSGSVIVLKNWHPLIELYNLFQ